MSDLTLESFNIMIMKRMFKHVFYVFVYKLTKEYCNIPNYMTHEGLIPSPLPPRNHKLKDRKYNGQYNKDKRTNNDLQNITQQHGPH